MHFRKQFAATIFFLYKITKRYKFEIQETCMMRLSYLKNIHYPSPLESTVLGNAANSHILSARPKRYLRPCKSIYI